MTNDITRRVSEHRAGLGGAFSKRYRTHRLVYLEEHRQINDAIAREKEIRGWRREKKLRLIEFTNAGRRDLAPTA